MTSRLYDYFMSCWMNRNITQAQLDTAVTKGYLTAEEEQTILTTPQP